MAKEIQGMMKTGQRKRRKMAVIKIQKQGNEQKSEENAQNKVKGGQKIRAKRGNKGAQTRAQKGCPK